MNDNLLKLTEIVSVFDSSSFYCNSYDEGSIRLQGHFKASTIKKATKLGFSSRVDGEQGWVTMDKENISITLTV